MLTEVSSTPPPPPFHPLPPLTLPIPSTPPAYTTDMLVLCTAVQSNFSIQTLQWVVAGWLVGRLIGCVDGFDWLVDCRLGW